MAKPTSFRFTAKERQKLLRLASQLGISQSDVIKLLLELGVRLLDEDVVEVLRQRIAEADNET